MTIWRLVVREILHRKLTFALGVAGAAVAVGVLVAQLVVLESHGIRTRQILEELHTTNQQALKELQATKMAELQDLQARQKAELKVMQDDYRKITKAMGFNVLILPAKQDLAEYHDLGQATQTMPEEYVTRLANSRVVTVRHLYPMVQQKLSWTERGGLRITVIGTRGEVPIAERDPKKPIVQAVGEGEIVIGHALHERLGIKIGDPVVVKDQKFTVAKVHEERGTGHDYTVWIPLAAAQKMFGLEGKINAIQALECKCAWADSSKVREDIAGILEDVQVVELASKAKARLDARKRAEQVAAETLAHQRKMMARALANRKIENASAVAEETARRDRLGRQRRTFATWLIPTALVGCCVWIAMLALLNVRQRRNEIGILRAIGLRGRSVLAVFLVRAAVVGLLGAAVGYVAGFVVGVVAGGVGFGGGGAADLFQPWVPPVVLLAAPLLAVLAGAAPAMLAAQQDPALVLSEE